MNKILSLSLTALLITAMGLFTFVLVLTVSHLAKENETYQRYSSCVLSVPAPQRDQNKIDKCWDVVQKDTGVNVKRYDKKQSP